MTSNRHFRRFTLPIIIASSIRVQFEVQDETFKAKFQTWYLPIPMQSDCSQTRMKQEALQNS